MLLQLVLSGIPIFLYCNIPVAKGSWKETRRFDEMVPAERIWARTKSRAGNGLLGRGI